MNRSILFSAVLLLLFFSLAAYAYPVKITDDKDSVNIGLAVEYYEDKESSLTLKDIIRLDNDNKFQTTTKLPLNFGYSKSTYWVSFSVLGKTDSESGWVLDIPYAPLDYLTLYVPNGKGDYSEYKSGDRIPFKQKHIEYKNAVFVLGQKLLPYQQYYLRVSSSGSINLPVFFGQGLGSPNMSTECRQLWGLISGL